MRELPPSNEIFNYRDRNLWRDNYLSYCILELNYEPLEAYIQLLGWWCKRKAKGKPATSGFIFQ